LEREETIEQLLRVTMFICLGFFAASCNQRGTLTFVDKSELTRTVTRVFAATNRNQTEGTVDFGSGRTSNTSFAQYDISIPLTHEPGKVEWSSGKPNPQKDIVIADARVLSKAEFSNALNVVVGKKGKRSGEAVVFVHGYNTNFAEGLYRFAQMAHDFNAGDVRVYFSWPSSGNVRGYVRDRDSVELARDNLQALLEDLSRSNVQEIVLVGHSLGNLSVMETLRQMAIEGKINLRGKLSGVALISPDIDVDLFRGQVERIGKLPQPFLVFVNENDKPLRLSSFLTQRESRLGMTSNLTELANLDITIINVTDISDDTGGSKHFTPATSPLIISFLSNRSVMHELSKQKQNQKHEVLGGFGTQTVGDQVREIRLESPVN